MRLKDKKIIVTAPAPQTADLIKDVSPEMLKYINRANFSQCISVLLGFNQSFDLPLNSFFYDEIGIQIIEKFNLYPFKI